MPTAGACNGPPAGSDTPLTGITDDLQVVHRTGPSHHGLRHFEFLDDADRDRLFERPPVELPRHGDPELLATALGATLYTPATRPTLARDIARQHARGAVGVVVCLEDAIADHEVPAAEVNAVEQLRRCAKDEDRMPLVFLRVRTPDQIGRIVEGLGEAAAVVSGFVLPKFTGAPEGAGGVEGLAAVEAASAAADVPLYAMPVLESPEIAFRETRERTLLDVRDALDAHRSTVMAVRLGVTDLCSVFGIRRPSELTIYDVTPIAQIIADIVNVFARSDASGYVVTGPVWEYFSHEGRMFKPLLRESPFVDRKERTLRATIIAEELDGLIREIVLDRAHGLSGKTVIHPTHVPVVHALSVVSHEEYGDAVDIVTAYREGGGVRSSSYGNKMNEAKPHRAWAERTLRRADAFGVSRSGIGFVDLLAASLPT